MTDTNDEVFPASKFTIKDKKNNSDKVINLFKKGLPTKSFCKFPTRSKYIFRPAEHTELEIQQIKYREANRRLKDVKIQERQTKMVFAEKWKELTDKLLEFRNNIKHFDNFCAANEDKRMRAMTKIEEEKVLIVKREIDFNILSEQIATLKYIKKIREEDVKKFKIYENFLDKVIPVSGEFKTIKNIITRYNVLKEVEAQTINDHQDKIAELKTAFEDMKHVHKKYHLREMELVGILTVLHSRHSETRNNKLKWEMAIEQVLKHAAKIRAETLGVLTATDNIYEMICTRRNQQFDKNVPLSEKFYEIKESMATNRKVLTISAKKTSTHRKKSRWDI